MQKRMKGSRMTENPVQGASPEPTPDQEQAKPFEVPSGHQQTTPVPVSAPANPTLRLDRNADDAPRPVYPQHQPSYGHLPQAQHAQTPPTEQFGAAQERGQQDQTYGHVQGAYPPAFGQPQQSQAPYGQQQYGPYSGNQPGPLYAS